jgi:hypothetical protein
LANYSVRGCCDGQRQEPERSGRYRASNEQARCCSINVASIGLQLGLINDEIFSILVLIAFVTTSMPPISLKLFLDRINYNFETVHK